MSNFVSSIPSNYVYDFGIDTGGSGTATIDPAQLQAINDAIGERVLRAGDTMTGNLVLNADPTGVFDATTKQYVDQIAGITFDDAGFQIYNTDDPTRIIKFSAANIDANTTRTYTMPNESGTICLLSDLNSQFPDNSFAVYDDVDITKSVRFETSAITTATQRVLTIPDADGQIALTSQLYTPPTTFADNSFAVYDDLTPSKIAQFDAAGLTNTRTYAFPDVSGTLALTSNIGVYQAPLSAGANIDPVDLAANTISVIPQFGDADFQIRSDLTPTAGVSFDASAVLVDQVVTLQSTSGTIAYLSDIQPQTSLIAGDYINSVALTTTDTISVNPQFDTSDFEIYDFTDNTRRVAFATDNITTATTREMRFPNEDQTLVGETSTQTLSNKSINMTGQTITNLTDAVLSHEPATKNQLDQLASGITAQGSADLVDEELNSAWSYNNGTAGVGATLTRNVVGAYSIDGVALVTGMSVLFTGNFGSARNGYYNVTEPGTVSLAAVFTRDPRFDGTTPENVRGSLFSVLQGDTRANTLWVQTSPDVVVIGTDSITYSTFSNTSVLTSGINTTINANAIDVDISQDLDMNNNKITNLLTPTADFDASTKKYVDDSIVASTIGIDASYAYITLSGSSANNTVHTMAISNSQGTDITLPNAEYALLQPGSYQIFSRVYAGVSAILQWIRWHIQTATAFGGPYTNAGRFGIVRNYVTTDSDTPNAVASALITVSVPTYVRSINGDTQTGTIAITGSLEIVRIDRRISAQTVGEYIGGNNIVINGNLIEMTAPTYHPSGSIVMTSNGNQLSLETFLLTDLRSQTFQDQSGTIALLSDIPGVVLPVYDDNSFTLVDNIDNTKTAKFQLDQIATGQIRTMTVPNKSGTLAMTSDVTTYLGGNNIAINGNLIEMTAPTYHPSGSIVITSNGNQLSLQTPLLTAGHVQTFQNSTGILALLSDLPNAGTTYAAGNQINLAGDEISVIDPFSVSNLRIKDGITNYAEISGVFTGNHSVTLPDKPGVVCYLDDLPAANVLGVYIEVGHEITADAGDSVVNTWTQRTLNTVYSITNTTATLVANQIVNLEAGTYDVQAISQFSKTGDACIRLYNVSGASQIMLGVFSPINPGAGAIANVCHLNGRFTLSVASTIELQYHASNNPSGTVDRGDYSGGLPGGVPVVITKMIIQTANSSSVGFNAIPAGSFYAKNYTVPKTFAQNPGDYQVLNIWGDVVGINSDWVTYDAQNRLYILSGVYNYDVSIEVFCSTSDVAQAQNFTCALTGGTNKLAPSLWGFGTEASGTTLANQIVKIKASFSNIQIAAGNYMGLAFRNNNVGDATNIKVYQVLLTIDRS